MKTCYICGFDANTKIDNRWYCDEHKDIALTYSKMVAYSGGRE